MLLNAPGTEGFTLSAYLSYSLAVTGLDIEGHMVLLYVSFNNVMNIAKEILK